MTNLAVNRFHAKLRLAASQETRMRRILTEVLDDGLETAIRRNGFGDAGELCIRSVHARVKLKLGETDTDLSAKLALAIAEAIQSEASKAGAGIVYYDSRTHALVDFVGSALSGDFNRAWAWRQMGISDLAFAVSAADAARQVLLALAAQPRQATAALAHLAGETLLFGRFLEHAPAAQLLDLARSVVEAMGGGAEILAPLALAVPALPALDEPAYRLVGRSRIAQATLAAGAARPPPHALAALAISEAEPAWLGGPVESARARLQAVALILSTPAGAKRPSARTRPATDETAQGRGSRSAGDDVAQDQQLRPAENEAAQDSLAQTGSASGPPVAGLETGPARQAREQAEADAGGGARDEAPPGLAPVAGFQGGSPPTGPAARDAVKVRPARPIPLAPGKHALPEVRRRGHTAFGGLLYLIHPAGRLAGRLLSEPRLSERSPRWCLHQLAMALAPVPASDPAALAFAGLLPDSPPPCEDQPPAGGGEREAIMALRQELLEDVRDRLARYAIAETARLDFVCRRPAEIVADPGWLEVHFPLEDVSTEIRATGLDLDPGWVPWLGLVVRFVYV